MAYGDFEDFARRTVFDNILRDKAFNIAKNPKYDGYQRGLSSMVYKFFDKKPKGCGVNNEIKQSEQLAEKLHKPIIRQLKKRKVYSSFQDNILDADLADMQLISNFSNTFRFLLCVIDIFSKCTWVVPLKDKKGVTIVNALQNISNIQKENQTKYGQMKVVNFITSMKSWLIQHTKKENLLLLKDLLEL